jgi:hypothetical protein
VAPPILPIKFENPKRLALPVMADESHTFTLQRESFDAVAQLRVPAGRASEPAGRQSTVGFTSEGKKKLKKKDIVTVRYILRIALCSLRHEYVVLPSRRDRILGHTYLHSVYRVPQAVDGGSSQKITSSMVLPPMKNTNGLTG